MKLQIKAMSPKIGREIPLPTYATPGSAGLDLRACLDAPLTIPPGGRVKVPTGLAIALPGPEWVALLFPRSGLAHKEGVTLSNCVGVVDSDYRGEIMVGLVNLDKEPYTLQPGDRFAQMVVMPVVQAQPELCGDLPGTDRGAGGFGSTGR